MRCAPPVKTDRTAVLGVDVGTTSVKALVLTDRGIAAEASVAHAVLTPHPGWIEEDATAWQQGVASAVSQVVARVPDHRIACVGVTSMVPALVLVDKQGGPLRPAILQSDSRAASELGAMALDPEEVLHVTGSPVNLQQIGPRFRWVAKHEPVIARHLARVMGASDYITWKLTGSCQVEQNWAMESGLWDFHRRDWVDAYLEAACVRRDHLPPVAPAMKVVGRISPEGARWSALPEGTAVIAGSADHIAAALGAGLQADGDLLVKIGAAGDILAVTREPKPDRRLFLDLHDIPGLFVANGCMVTSGVLLEWLKELCSAPNGRNLRELDNAARDLGPTAGGLIALPYFSGEKTPIFDPHARGVILGLTLAHRRAHLHRALMEGVAYGARHHVDVLRELGIPVRRVLLADGGAKSPLWRQILADVLDTEVTAYPGHGGSALGVAFLAGMAVGVFEHWSDIDRFLGDGVQVEPGSDAAVYASAYTVFRDLYVDVKRHMAAMARMHDIGEDA